jgi:hypothetical protein
MVSAIKKWLGIDKLERENLTLAKALLAETKQLDRIEESATKILNLVQAQEKSLTLEPAKPKMVPKSKPVNWKNFKSAAEKEAQEEA